MPPPRVEADRESLRTNLTLLFLRAVRVVFTGPLVPLGVVITGEGFVAVTARVLLLRPGLFLPNASGLGAPGLFSSGIGRASKDLLVGGGGSGVAFA